jgi:hypothetical protein
MDKVFEGGEGGVGGRGAGKLWHNKIASPLQMLLYHRQEGGGERRAQHVWHNKIPQGQMLGAGQSRNVENPLVKSHGDIRLGSGGGDGVGGFNQLP